MRGLVRDLGKIMVMRRVLRTVMRIAMRTLMAEVLGAPNFGPL